MESIHIRWWGCGGFEVLMDEVNFFFDPYLFPPYLDDIEPIYDYIFCTHEHFDHTHRPSLTKLCRGDRFKKLILPVGAIHPAQPIDQVYGTAASADDLPVDYVPADKIQILYPKYLTDDDRDRFPPAEMRSRRFPGPFEIDLEDLHVEAAESGEAARPDLPTNGYLVTDKKRDLSFYHMGDLWQAYPALEGLKDRVDFAIHMKLGTNNPWEELDKFADYVRPKYVVPIHYGTDRASDPVPKGHWPPPLDDPFAYIEDLRRRIGDRTRIVPLTAGIQYELLMPSKEINWKWKRL